ncbi:uncharacterized protein LOC124923679 [Impatiens glandulifera]|uniref:uncharacterized protein LOC124923679 n=1 Tax=Impatiens glandulifera TaxID=253017 RepID=UPI001FB17460|nr:uncharacterized protein LOC124923679 [Impatiens glandulifera]
MHRSSSTNRVYDEYLKYYSSPSDELPVLEPLSESSKKVRSRTRFSDNAIHAIPFLLLLCALILWFLSNPYLELPRNEASVREMDGTLAAIDSDTDQTGVLAAIDMMSLDSTKGDDDNDNKASSFQ